MENKVTIKKELCTGLFILGALSYYNNEEVLKYPSIQYIASILHKKHFSIKNGSAEDRILVKEQYIRNEVRSLGKKAKNEVKIQRLLDKHKRAVLKAVERNNSWKVHSDIANTSWLKASASFKAESAITVSALILSILRKEPKTLKWYGFNQKKLDRYQKSSEAKDLHIFSSSRVATSLLENLDSEVSYYYHS